MTTNRRALLTSALSQDICHPGQVAGKLFDSARAKAGKRGLEFDLLYTDVLQLVEHGECPVLGIPFDMRQGTWLPWRASLDRRDNTRGYHWDNIQVVAKIVNQAKGPWEMSEFDIMCLARAEVLKDRDR
jgi:hypothetical protein